MAGEETVVECAQQVKIRDLRIDQREKLEAQRPTTQKVGADDQPLDFVEQLRDLLDLIDDDGPASGGLG
ncbi:MAG: hypothetical protein NTY77_20000 [Elusimicrobia bacterium]|nr:hypothetical protein [Elusimicrobiota bacterium]